jgi:Ca-activated chloride channel family protein
MRITRKKQNHYIGIVAFMGAQYALGLFLWAGSCFSEDFSQDPSPSSATKASPLKVDVNLVLINGTVMDSQSRIVTGLEKDHFQIFEDKVEQKITTFSNEDAPASIAILFDISGSMKDKLPQSRDALTAFLRTSNPSDEFMLITFHDVPKVEVGFTSNVADIQNKMAYTVGKGCTTLYDAIYLGLERLKHAHNSRKAIMLITDGDDTCSRYLLSNIRREVKESDVVIYAIGIVDGFSSSIQMGRTGREVLQDLADYTGGEAFFPTSPFELEEICTKIAIALKNEYVLGYSSANKAMDGHWHKVRVKLHPPKGLSLLSIHFKSGYFGQHE